MVADITEYINNGISKADNVNKMLDIQLKFEGKYVRVHHACPPASFL